MVPVLVVVDVLVFVLYCTRWVQYSHTLRDTSHFFDRWTIHRYKQRNLLARVCIRHSKKNQILIFAGLCWRTRTNSKFCPSPVVTYSDRNCSFDFVVSYTQHSYLCTLRIRVVASNIDEKANTHTQDWNIGSITGRLEGKDLSILERLPIATVTATATAAIHH